MKTNRLPHFLLFLSRSALAAVLVGAFTVLLFLIGRQTLGEAVVALVYLFPIVWCTMRWGSLPGVSAALTAALSFDFFFIPPYHTFAVGSLEGWLVLLIFAGVAILFVDRIQAGLAKTNETIFLYELTSALSVALTSDAVARIVAKYIQQLKQAYQVRVVFFADGPLPEIVVDDTPGVQNESHPDRLLPVVNDKGFVGEIQIWNDAYWPPAFGKDPLLEQFAFQAGRALGRARQSERENATPKPAPARPKKR
jgi:K+-sensing histidine kinase KdpD